MAWAARKKRLLQDIVGPHQSLEPRRNAGFHVLVQVVKMQQQQLRQGRPVTRHGTIDQR